VFTGGQPVIMSQPPIQYGQPPVQYAQPRPPQSAAQAPQPWPPRPVAQQQPVQQPVQQKPQVATQPRPYTAAAGKIDDVPQELVKAPVKMAPLTLPAPEALGVAAAAVPAKVDWNTTLERVRGLGGIGHDVVQLTDGRYRVAFVVRTGQSDQIQSIVATGGTEAEAVTAALARTEEFVRTGK
jgi:hypothetical protein